MYESLYFCNQGNYFVFRFAYHDLKFLGLFSMGLHSIHLLKVTLKHFSFSMPSLSYLLISYSLHFSQICANFLLLHYYFPFAVCSCAEKASLYNSLP